VDPEQPDDGVVIAAGTVRGTQSFVHILARCWRHPSWTALEIGWRWAFGLPALLLVGYEAERILRETPLDLSGLQRISLLDPMPAAQMLAQILLLLGPPVLRVAMWLGPLLLVVWIVVSSVGRTAVLRRVDGRLSSCVATVIALQAIRVVALLASFVVWFQTIRWAARITVTGPIAAGGDPNLVGYFALAIVATLGLFTLWAVASWCLSVAPLLAMLEGLGVAGSLAAAFRLGPLRSKLVEINLVMGIVKIALIVLAMVLSASPLPLESVATPEFLHVWWVAVTLAYFVASDFFHVVRLVSYLELWRAYEGDGAVASLAS
jgi:hypothetical protein